MIKLYTSDTDDQYSDSVLWKDDDNQPYEKAFIYSNFIELFSQNGAHLLIPMHRIDKFEWHDVDIANGRVKIMEPVRGKQ